MAPDLTSAELTAFGSLESVLALPGQMLADTSSNFLKKVKVADSYYYIKCYYRAGKYLRKFLGRSKAAKEWRNIGWFESHQIPTSRPLVWGEMRRWCGDYVGIIVTEEVKQTIDLEQAYRTNARLFRQRESRQLMIRRLAAIVSAMHGAGFIHNDLHWRNILIGPEAESIRIIDCPAGRPIYLPGHRRGPVKDLALLDKLAQQALSRTDRMRFYLHYCGVKSLGVKQKRELGRIVKFLGARKSKHVNAATLTRTPGDIQTLFELQVRKANGQMETIELQKTLRLLPGKRMVAQASVNGTQILAKVFLGRTAQRNSAREQLGVQHFMRAGVPTPNLLWHGELVAEDGQMLAFEYIGSAVSLQSAWDKAREDEERLDILTRAIIIIAKLHNQSIIQADIHLDNFLVSNNRIYIIDGGRVSRQTRSPLSEQISLENLSCFFAQFFPKFDVLASRVMPAYEDIRGWQQDSKRCTTIQKHIFNSRESRKKHYLKKIFRNCTRFVCISSCNEFLMVERSEYDESLQSLLADPEGYIARGEMLKNGDSSTVVLIKLPGRAVVIKRYNIKNIWHGIRRALRNSRAWTSWSNAHRLAFLGIPSLKPIAMLERRIGPLRSRAYFISAYIEAPDPLTCLPQLENSEVQAKSLALLLEHLSANRIVHGDLKASNFLMAEDGPLIIDLDAMRAYKNSAKFQGAFNKDLRRFMQNWEGQPALSRQFQGLLAKLYF